MDAQLWIYVVMVVVALIIGIIMDMKHKRRYGTTKMREVRAMKERERKELDSRGSEE